MNWILFIVFSIAFAPLIKAECNYTSCGSCIENGCSWCAVEDFTMLKEDRCKEKSLWNSSNCLLLYTEKPFKIPNRIEDKNFSSEVLLKPQHYEVIIGNGNSSTIEVSYKQTADTNLDIYFLVQLPRNKNDLLGGDKIKKVAEEFQNEYKNTNIKAGYGYFSEKPAIPYSFLSVKSLFHHVQKLIEPENMRIHTTTDEDPNEDHFTAGLDALMDVMLCEDRIGWRNDAKRVVILITDSLCHAAGDGKMAGAFLPHNGKCHLDKTEDVTNIALSLTMDYPSGSHIRKVALDTNTIIMFYVIKTIDSIIDKSYKNLINFLYGTGAMYVNGKDPGLKNLVSDYKIANRILQLRIEAPKHIVVKDQCREDECIVTEDKEFTINVTLTLKSCGFTASGKNTDDDQVRIWPAGSRNVKLIIDIDYLCRCDCQKTIEKQSIKCSSAGDYSCGLCSCEKFETPDCACPTDEEACKRSRRSMACEGHGNCICGKCKCEAPFKGPFCTYTDNMCPNSCTGKENGKCIDGQYCECERNWEGEDCSCNKNITCVDKDTKKDCSGKGSCKCGKCNCAPPEQSFITRMGDHYCKECALDCPTLNNYVTCLLENGTCKKPKYLEYTELRHQRVENFNQPIWRIAKACMVSYENGSRVEYKTYCDERNGKQIIATRARIDPKQLNIWVIVGSVGGGIFLTGIIAIVIWKIVTTIHDNREYEKLLQMAKEVGLNVYDNPLYDDPTTAVANPMYDSSKNNLRQRKPSNS